MHAPTDRILLIERSLRCFVFGLLSLVPLVGLGPAVLAIRMHFKTRAGNAGEWNPAQRYVRAGYGLAWLGTLLSLGIIALFVVFLMQRYDYV